MSESQKDNEEGFSLNQWAESQPEYFDVNEVYLIEIKPLLDQLFDKCIELKIPLVYVVALKDSAEDTELTCRGNFESPERTPFELLLAKEAAKSYSALELLPLFAANVKRLENNDRKATAIH